MGARGNSGVILSQILRGLADTFSDHDEASAADLVAGFRRATDAAYQAVLRPVEGTILTVVRAAAEAVEAAYEAGERSLAGAARPRRAPPPGKPSSGRPSSCPCSRKRAWSTPAARASRCCSTRSSPSSTVARCREPEVVDDAAVGRGRTSRRRRRRRCGTRSCTSSRRRTRRSPRSRTRGRRLGDSIVVVGGDGLWNCHVHTNDIGAAIEAGIEAGRPRSIRVTDLLEQVEEEQWVREGGHRPDARIVPEQRTAVEPARRPLSRSASAKAYGVCCSASASTRSSPAGSR